MMHLSFYYGLAADRREYCFTKDLKKKKNLKFFFELKPLFFQIRIENSLGVHPLIFAKISLVSG